MSTIMLATVGGSPQPIVRGIGRYEPDHVVFICSPASTKEVDGLAQKAKLRPGSFTSAEPVQADDPTDTYRRVLQEFSRARAQFSGCRLVVNYTGGTKSMAAGALLAAVDDGDCELCLVTGDRPDLMQVKDGTERVYPVDARYAIIKRQVRQALEHMGRFDYPAAESVLYHCPTGVQATAISRQVQALYQIARGLGAWDRFQHAEADSLLGSAREWLDPKLLALLGRSRKAIVALEERQQAPSGEEKAGEIFFDPVYDLILNAQRRGAQERYDDAVARLYRALELYAQIALFRLPQPINTSNVDVVRLPEHLRPAYEAQRHPESGKVQVGLYRAYQLLVSLDPDKVGRVFSKWDDPLKSALEIRNRSILAHGFRPVTKDDYEKVLNTVVSFIQDCDEVQRLRPRLEDMQQFPTTFPVDLDSGSQI